MHQNLKMLLVLSCAFNPPALTGYGSGRCSGEERIRQYIVGFETFFNGHERFKEFDIVLTDNTILGIDEIDTRILSKIPKDTKINNNLCMRLFFTKIIIKNKSTGINLSA